MDWMLALAQHPMYFLIKEDTQCAERTPPWGAPNIEKYIDRVKENLAAVRQYAELKIGYEWSGLELELLAQDAPEVFREMCTLAKEGRIAFYNGTYSQPHLQTLSSEANYRQFEHGMRVYRELCHQPVGTYAHQEASVHDQMPQLMQAFGIKYGVLPGGFSSTLVWLDGGEMVVNYSTPYFPSGREFTSWRGLDGTEIPLCLWTQRKCDPGHWVARRVLPGQLRVPPLVVASPDMIAVNGDWVAERKGVEFVLLDDVLGKQLEAHPPRSKVRHFCNWSYIEGIRAEDLSRANWDAEVTALRAEALNALAFALTGRTAEPTDAVWKKILTTQHHDVYCFCSTELKDKSIRWLEEATSDATRMADEAAQAIVAQVNCKERPEQPIVVFNTVPHAQKSIVTCKIPMEDPSVVDGQGHKVPSESVAGDDGFRRVRFLADMPGMGYATYRVGKSSERVVEQELNGTLEFENTSYKAAIQADGAFSSLVVKPSGFELLGSGPVRGNQLAAMDTTGLGLEREEGQEREFWTPPEPGPQLHWESTTPTRVRRCPLGVSMTALGRMGGQISASLTVMFYHQIPRIDIEWTFTFDSASIGIFFDDDSKLRVHWPLSFDGDIHHDIAFGVVRTRDECPFFPASWVDLCDGENGLAYFHQGTPKHWVSDRTLINLFAWGEDTDAIGNRMDTSRWYKAFDQRLHGRHTIRSALYPHTGDWRCADVTGAARSYGSPPVAYLADAHTGGLPAAMEVLCLQTPGLASTAVKVEGTDIICRLYSSAEENAGVHGRMQDLRSVGLRSLDGKEIEQLRPFQIGEWVLRPGK